MAGYVVRSLAQLASEARSALAQAVQGTASRLLPNVWRVEGKVLALLGFEHEQRRAFLYDQIFASTAGERWLARHGFELGLAPAPAASAIGIVIVAATPGTVVPAGLRFGRGDGAIYTTLAAETATGTTVALTVEADLAGAAGNADPGIRLTLADPDEALEGLDTEAVVGPEGLAGGGDPEALESFRARVLARKRRPPQGGAAPDYETWTREALLQVDRVWVDSFNNDARSVWVAFTVTDQPDGIPTPGQVAVVQNYINDAVRRPVTARAYAVAPARLPVPVTIRGLTPDTLDVRQSVDEEVNATFADLAEPGRPSGATVFSRSWLTEAVARAVGEDRHEILSPVNDIEVPPGFIPVWGGIAYTD